MSNERQTESWLWSRKRESPSKKLGCEVRNVMDLVKSKRIVYQSYRSKFPSVPKHRQTVQVYNRADTIHFLPTLREHWTSNNHLSYCEASFWIISSNIQFNANHLNESRARVELYKLYTGPAFIQVVCIKLYLLVTKKLKTVDESKSFLQ